WSGEGSAAWTWSAASALTWVTPGSAASPATSPAGTSAATPLTIHRSWVTVPWWAATAAAAAPSEVAWTMTAVWGAASDARAGVARAGAIHAPSRTNRTPAMSFRFARMNAHDRRWANLFHSPYASLAALRGCGQPARGEIRPGWDELGHVRAGGGRGTIL